MALKKSFQRNAFMSGNPTGRGNFDGMQRSKYAGFNSHMRQKTLNKRIKGVRRARRKYEKNC